MGVSNLYKILIAKRGIQMANDSSIADETDSMKISGWKKLDLIVTLVSLGWHWKTTIALIICFWSLPIKPSASIYRVAYFCFHCLNLLRFATFIPSIFRYEEFKFVSTKWCDVGPSLKLRISSVIQNSLLLSDYELDQSALLCAQKETDFRNLILFTTDEFLTCGKLPWTSYAIINVFSSSDASSFTDQRDSAWILEMNVRYLVT